MAERNEAVAVQLDREDFILMLMEANERIHRKRTLDGITRLVKLVYLLEKETEFQGVAVFEFKPHNFGPFSKGVYEAVEFLESCNLIETREREYPSFYATEAEAELFRETEDASDEEMEVMLEEIRGLKAREVLFQLTDDGRTVAGKLREAVERHRPKDLKELDRIVADFAAMSLQALIRYVYRRYPDMTTKSIHPEAQRLKRQKK